MGGIDLYNDAYNANPESVVAALETFAELAADAGRRIVVLGDMLELGDEAEELQDQRGKDAHRAEYAILHFGRVQTPLARNALERVDAALREAQA